MVFHVKQFTSIDDLPIEQQQLLDSHLELVLEENTISNLTRIIDKDQGKLLHIEDSLVALPEFMAAPAGPYIDLGTGGGFPGIPIAITTGRNTLLVDSVGKKTKALDRIITKLNLSDQVATYTGRAEELALEQPASAAVISARALSSLPSLLELAAPLLQMGGVLIAYKGQPESEEITHAQELEEKLGMKLISQRPITLSDGDTQRTILVFEKVGEPTVKLPRRPGMAQKKPY